jgi:hypothetical protein
VSLEQIARVLLDEASPQHLVEAALDRYSRICAEATGVVPDAGFGAWEEDRFLDSGIAISPRAAANCVTDYRRTLVFLRAVHAALTKLQATHDTGVVDVLYAGCGPWATLLLPLLDEFPPERLRVRLLDAHASALESVRRLVELFGLEAHAISTEVADASIYRCTVAPQLIVAETMHKALEQEPQYAVTANLAPQLAPDGIFVPERIDVDLCVSRDGARQRLGRLLSLSAQVHPVPEPVWLPVPSGLDVDAGQLELVTSIRVFEDHWLLPGEAHITLPRPCPGLLPLAAGARLRVEFRCGTFPVFEIGSEAPPAAAP